MYKIKFLLLSIIVALGVTGCNNDLNGDSNELDGKPGTLQLRINSGNLKTRAVWEPGVNTPENEKTISNLTVFILKADGNFDAATYYYSDATFENGGSYDIPVTKQADSLKVVTNMGSPADPNSILGVALSKYYSIDTSTQKLVRKGGFPFTKDSDALDMIRLNLLDDDGDGGAASANIPSVTNEGVNASIADAPQDGSPANDNSSPASLNNTPALTQTGVTKLIWSGSSAIAEVQLRFLAARISIEDVTLFGLYGSTLEQGQLGSVGYNDVRINGSAQAKADYAASPVYGINIVGVYILNTPATTCLFDATKKTSVGSLDLKSSVVTETKNLYSGDTSNSDTNTSNANKGPMAKVVPTPGLEATSYFPDPANNYTTKWNTALWTDLNKDADGGIPGIKGEYPTFYVWENADNGNDRSGITLAVIACQVTYKPADWAQRLALNVENPLSGKAPGSDIQTLPSIDSTSPTEIHTEIRYYTVVLDNAVNSKATVQGGIYANYSTKRGVHYHIRADISSDGRPTPYNPNSFGLRIYQTDWDDLGIQATFK